MSKLLFAFLFAASAGAAQQVITNSIGMELVRIEPGVMQAAVFEPTCPTEKDFPPGDPPEKRWTPAQFALCHTLVRQDASPGFPVKIARAFYIGKFEVTQAQFLKVMGRNPSKFQSREAQDDAGRHPVEEVSWRDAQSFISKLNALEKTHDYRLPSEFEWEYAGRAGGRGQVDWDVIRRQAVIGVRAKPGEPTPTTARVGSLEPNAWGLYDMLGNVWEWVEDFYNEKTFPDPTPPRSGAQHVLKGAGFLSDVKNAIYTTHAAGPADGWDVGFRVVKQIEAPGAQQEAASPGQSVYTANCVFCHGPGARGGSQGGPDLAKSPIVRGDSEGAELAVFLNVGRPEKGMPAFHLPLPRLKNLAAYLHSVVAASEGRPQFAEEILVGNAAAGKRFFESDGGCTQCHAVDQDLKGIGSKYSPLVLQGRLVLPIGKGGYPGFEAPDAPRSQVTITEPDGRSQSGLLLFLSDYYVSFLDSTGQRHTVPREGDTPKVAVKDPLAAHLALESRLTDQQMHNLTAYLASLK